MDKSHFMYITLLLRVAQAALYELYEPYEPYMAA